MKRWFQVGAVSVMMAAASSAAMARHTHIVNTPDNQLANETMQNLLSSPLGRKMPRLHYSVTLLDERQPNAFSDFQGHVYVTRGLFPALDGDRGVWAAVIGHELGHVILHHRQYLPAFEAQLRQDYVRSRAQGYDAGPAAWPDVKLGHGISELKLSREEELQADFIGMMLMAEAGYQPGFAVLLDQRLRNGLGDTPGIVAAFSHHPRLETRQAHAEKFYGVAMDIFRMRWPTPQNSPGGNLPPYGQIGRWTLQMENGQLVFRVPYQIHNAEGMNVRVTAIFLQNDTRVRSVDSKYRAVDGSWELNSFAPGPRTKANRQGDAVLRGPASALAPHDDHLTAVVFLMAGSRVVDLSTLHTHLGGK
ncbi:MAG: M48 family metalloprotease [Terriglobia bacterium]